MTIAGSDSGGGAGVQADLKTFAALGIHGTSVITCLTAQNPRAVLAVQPARPSVVRQQLEAIASELPPRAAKTGMLYSETIIGVVADFLEAHRRLPLVVDPVMVATSGGRLLKTSAIERLEQRLLPRATLITPNLDEAQWLSGIELKQPEDLRKAVRVLRSRYGCAVLAKGGHLEGNSAIDIFWDGREELLLSAMRIRGVSSHGTGCTYSAAIAGYLAMGCGLRRAVEMGKQYITSALTGSRRVGRHAVLGHFFGVRGGTADQSGLGGGQEKYC